MHATRKSLVILPSFPIDTKLIKHSEVVKPPNTHVVRKAGRAAPTQTLKRKSEDRVIKVNTFLKRHDSREVASPFDVALTQPKSFHEDC